MTVSDSRRADWGYRWQVVLGSSARLSTGVPARLELRTHNRDCDVARPNVRAAHLAEHGWEVRRELSTSLTLTANRDAGHRRRCGGQGRTCR